MDNWTIFLCFAIRIFSPFFARGLDHVSLCFIQISLLFARLSKLFCFYNLTKVSSYILLHAVPLNQ